MSTYKITPHNANLANQFLELKIRQAKLSNDLTKVVAYRQQAKTIGATLSSCYFISDELETNRDDRNITEEDFDCFDEFSESHMIRDPYDFDPHSTPEFQKSK